MKTNNKLVASLSLASALGLAIIPLTASATTANLGEDRVTITVKTGCTLTAANGTDDFSLLNNQYAGAVAPGEPLEIENAEAGKLSVFNVKCNEAGTYAISAVATPLLHTDEETTIAVSEWGLKYNGAENYLMFNGESQTLVSKNGNATGENEPFTINSYKINTTAATKTGAYTGKVTYTLTYDGV